MRTGADAITFHSAGFSFLVAPLGDAYGGYCDGLLSVTADWGDIAARALMRKHVHGLPAGALVDLATERRLRDIALR